MPPIASPEFVAEPFVAETVASQLAGKLRQMVEQGRWDCGEKLPTVRQLAEQFSVSPNSAQEAIHRLVEDNVLLSRPRQGVFVKWDERENSRSAVDSDLRAGEYEVGVIRSLESVDKFNDQYGWSGQILHAFERHLMSAEVHVVNLSYLCEAGDVSMQICRRIEQYPHRIAAAVCLPGAWNQTNFKMLRERSIHLVSINAPSRRSTHNFVAADNIEGGRRVGRCFGELERRRVLCLINNQSSGISDKEKVLGIYEGLMDAGQTTDRVVLLQCNGCNEDNGYKETFAYLKKVKSAGGAMPEAIFTGGDFLALGAIRACREMGMKVPEDVGVVGTTGLQASAYMDPPLTVLAQPMEKMGKAAAEMVLTMLESGESRLPAQRICSPLIVRQSMSIPKELAQRIESEYQEELNK